MTTLLMLTVGQSDVQLVVDGVRREFPKERCAALHDEIEHRGYFLCDAPILKETAVETLPEGELSLCTPKLDAVLGKEPAAAALVLETRRDAITAPGDPRFAGTVLEARLKTKGVGTIRRQSYLQNLERLEDRDEPRDAVIRREIVQRLDRAIRETIEAVKPSRVVIAATGGFPVVTNLVEEIVRLYASVSIEALEVADGTKANPPTADRAVARTSVPEPLASFQARRRAIELVENGNLLGAWGAVRHLHNDELEVQWTRVIEWLSRFAASLPIPEKCDIAVLRHGPMAVRAALRVEFALRAGDIPRAVHGTVAFFEAALWDWLKQRDFAADGASGSIEDGFTFSAEPTGEKKKRFRRQRQSEVWKINDFKEGIDAWVEVLNKPRLSAFWKALTDDIRDLRNDVAHNEPTEALIENANRRMDEAGLWSTGNGFLTQTLVQHVLEELGEQHPKCLCADLIKAVRERLLAFTAGAK